MEYVEKAILSILEQLFEKTGNKHDAYFTEGVGVQIVRADQDFIPENIVLTVNEMRLRIMQTTGQELNIHVE